jgi:DNA-binding NarL/FixJ family response regulator
MDRYQVIVVDDHAMFRDALRLILPTEEFEITGEAGTAKEAVALCVRSGCDLIVLDAGLPDAEPEALVRMLRSSQCQQTCSPILLLTLHEDAIFLGRLIKAGCRGIVAKKEPAEVLLAAARTVAAGGEYLSPTTALRISFAKQAIDLRSRLSDRQREIITHVARGLQDKEIAQLLNLGLETVRTHRRLAMEKLGATNAIEAARIVRRELMAGEE